MRQNIFTIAPERPFLATLARGLLDMAAGDPLKLARMTVLLPTRRAARALREAFLRLSGEEGSILKLTRSRSAPARAPMIRLWRYRPRSRSCLDACC